MRTLRLHLLLACFISTGCLGDEKWEGFVYPDKSNLFIHETIGEYKSLESCRYAALSKLAEIKSEQKGDYECGLNCEHKDFAEIKTCERTDR